VGPTDPPPLSAGTFGTPQDPLVGQRVGGINVFGGGLALYVGGKRVGGLGVSGDTSRTDHMVAWWTRSLLKLAGFSGVGGVSGDSARPDNIIFDIAVNKVGVGAIGVSAGGFGGPTCLNNPTPQAVLVCQRYNDLSARRWDGTIPALIAALPRPLLAALLDSRVALAAPHRKAIGFVVASAGRNS
jgi:hypothetical protein